MSELETESKISFMDFVSMLNGQALMHLGVIKNPLTGSYQVNLFGARETIEILKMLREKTQGNLTDDEAKTMDNLVFDLQMRYVAIVRSGGAPPVQEETTQSRPEMPNAGTDSASEKS